MGVFAGKVAVVTGAASGIGQALALELGRGGAELAISDVDSAGLATTEQRLQATGARVRAERVDVSDRDAMEAYSNTVKDHFGTVNQIYNNAGIVYTGDVAVSPYQDIERVMNVDFWSVVHGTKAFLPHLIESGDGHVINVSSVYGLLAGPGQSAYNAAKFAVRGFTEALQQEVLLARHPMAVTVVHPGGVKTAIARNATAAEGLDRDALAAVFDNLASTSPEKAAKIILSAVQRRKARVLVGPDAKALDLFVRITGSGSYQRIYSALAARATSGSHLAGKRITRRIGRT